MSFYFNLWVAVRISCSRQRYSSNAFSQILFIWGHLNFFMTFEGQFFWALCSLLTVCIYLFCVYKCFGCVHGHCMCASRLQRPEDARELELQIRVNIHEVLESKLVLLQEQDVFLITKPPLSSWPFFFPLSTLSISTNFWLSNFWRSFWL